MKKNYILSLLGGAIVLCIVSFYGGVTYAKKNIPQAFGRNAAWQQGSMQSRSSLREGGMGSRQGNGSGMRLGNIVAGKILSLDENSFVVEFPGGGSRIVRISDTTKIQKMTDTERADLVAGKEVMINGETNQDGSVSASSVQIRD